MLSAIPKTSVSPKNLLFIRQDGFRVPGPFCPSLSLEGVYCACKTLEEPHLCCEEAAQLCFPRSPLSHTAQVSCAIPGTPTCAVLVTSRVAVPLETQGTGIAGLLQVTAPWESSHTTCSSPDPSENNEPSKTHRLWPGSLGSPALPLSVTARGNGQPGVSACYSFTISLFNETPCVLSSL